MEIRPLTTVHPPRLPVPFIRAVDSRYPFVPFGLVPLVGLVALLIVALLPFAFGEVQAATQASAEAALRGSGATWASARADGQWVILEGKPPSREAAFDAERAVKRARADTLFGKAAPATWVISRFTWLEDPLLPPGAGQPRLPDADDPAPARAPTPSNVPTQAEAEACDTTMAGLLASARVEFPSNSAEIGAGSTALLDAIASAASYCRGSLRVEGYTDNIGGGASNIALSRRRAESVRAALIARGVEANRLVAQGFGAANPVASNHSEQGRARNRRIEIRTVRSQPT